MGTRLGCLPAFADAEHVKVAFYGALFAEEGLKQPFHGQHPAPVAGHVVEQDQPLSAGTLVASFLAVCDEPVVRVIAG
jgi:hypothetical protein